MAFQGKMVVHKKKVVSKEIVTIHGLKRTKPTPSQTYPRLR